MQGYRSHPFSILSHQCGHFRRYRLDKHHYKKHLGFWNCSRGANCGVGKTKEDAYGALQSLRGEVMKTTMDKLLPCPFCGGDALDLNDGYYCCTEDKCPGAALDCTAEQWNTRHTPEGWQLVPAKADAGMKVAAWKIWDNKGDAQHQVWQAMLAAAPKWGGE